MTGFLRRMENENGHGTVMEHEKLAKSHGILPILPMNCTKFLFVFTTTKKLSIDE